MAHTRKSSSGRTTTGSGRPAGGKPERSSGAQVEPEARQARRVRLRQRSREDILEGARRVILKHGIPGATLDAVAREVGMSKPALYYYFPSKDALLFELVHGVMEDHAQAVHGAVDMADSGAAALDAIVRASFRRFAPRLDDFRLAFLHGQVAGKDAMHLDEAQFARVRPLNDLWFKGAADKLREQRKGKRSRARVEPRLLAFLAYCAAIGVLTMKGMVENLDDPLRYSDKELIDGLARVFEAASDA